MFRNIFVQNNKPCNYNHCKSKAGDSLMINVLHLVSIVYDKLIKTTINIFEIYHSCSIFKLNRPYELEGCCTFKHLTRFCLFSTWAASGMPRVQYWSLLMHHKELKHVPKYFILKGLDSVSRALFITSSKLYNKAGDRF